MTTTATAAPAQEAGRAQPQTTIEPPGGPFIRHAQVGRRAIYSRSGDTIGSLITQPIPSSPGYLRAFRVRIQAAGGVGSSTAAVSGADQPFNIGSLVTVKDAFGTTLISAPGFETFRLIPMFSGQHGLHALSDPASLPMFSAVASPSGNFIFSSTLPFEFAKGYGVISGANASLLPTITIQGNPSPYATAPAPTLPTLQTDIEADFYWLPEGTQIEPPGLGSTCQWSLAQGSPPLGSGSNVTVSLPRLGGFLTTLIFILRDSTGVRIDPFTGQTNPRFRLKLDGVAVVDTRWDTFLDDMQIQFAGTSSGAAPGWTRPAGTWAWSRKQAMNQEVLGLLDTGEMWLSTNPGTLIEIEAANWGTITNTPATLNVLAGQVVPTGSIIQGLPEL
jgi:hypothetical protein